MGEFNIATVTGPALTVTNTYDPDRSGGILLTKANTRNIDQSAISSVNYIVNTLGQRKERTTTDAANNSATTEWTYDALGQVETEDQPGTTTDRAYQYDHIGNRKKSANSLTLPATDNYTTNALNQYTSITSDQLTSEPQYDFDGNMTQGPHPADPTIPALFFYDAENRLLEIRNATTGVTLLSNHYDAFHRLIRITAQHNGQSTTEHILWNGWTLVSRFVSNGNSLSETFHYTWGTDLSGSEQGAGGVGGLLAITRVPTTGNASTRYPLYDGNGNITALVTTNGSLSATYQYDAFGNTLSATDNDASGWVNHNIHGFSTKPTFGHQGLHYYGYRWYNAPQGRWINRDSIEERGGLNLYGFVGNDGVGKIDVLGESPDFPDCCKEEEKAVDKARKDYIKKFDDYDKARTAHQKAMADVVSSSTKSLIATAAAGLACAKCIATKSPWDCRACALASIAAAAALYDHHQKVMDEIGKGIDKGLRKDLADKAYKDYDKAMRDRDDCWEKADPRCFCPPIEPPPSPIFL